MDKDYLIFNQSKIYFIKFSLKKKLLKVIFVINLNILSLNQIFYIFNLDIKIAKINS